MDTTKAELVTDASKIEVEWDGILGGAYASNKALEACVIHLRVVTPFKLGRLSRAEEDALCKGPRPEHFAYYADGNERRCPKCEAMATRLGLKTRVVNYDS